MNASPTAPVPSFLSLPTDVLLPIVFQWVGSVPDLAAMDSAVRNRYIREAKWLKLLRHQVGVIDGLVPKSNRHANNIAYLKWLSIRGIKVKKLELYWDEKRSCPGARTFSFSPCGTSSAVTCASSRSTVPKKSASSPRSAFEQLLLQESFMPNATADSPSTDVHVHDPSYARDPSVDPLLIFDLSKIPVEAVEVIMFRESVFPTYEFAKLFSFGRMSKLVVLDFSRAKSDVTAKQIEDTIKQCKKGTLREIILCDAHCVNDSVINTIANCCHGSLRKLDIRWCYRATGASLSELVRTCGKTLHTLDFCGCGVDNATLMSIAKCCKGELTYLDVSFSSFPSPAVALLAEALGDTLTSLIVRKCNLTDSAVLKIAQHCRVLSKLNISGCYFVTDDAICRLARLCGSSLSCLDLSDCCFLSDQSLYALAQYCSPYEGSKTDAAEKVEIDHVQGLGADRGVGVREEVEAKLPLSLCLKGCAALTEVGLVCLTYANINYTA